MEMIRGCALRRFPILVLIRIFEALFAEAHTVKPDTAPAWG